MTTPPHTPPETPEQLLSALSRGLADDFMQWVGTQEGLLQRIDEQGCRDLAQCWFDGRKLGQQLMARALRPPGEPLSVMDIPMHSDQQLQDACRLTARNLIEAVRTTDYTLHRMLCDCVSADCSIRIAAQKLVKQVKP